MAGKKTSKKWLEQFRLEPGSGVRLSACDASATPGVKDRAAAEEAMPKLAARMNDRQEILYAGAQKALLVVLQAMDTGGKDGTIRHVFGPLNPQGVRVQNFKAPTIDELAHDYLHRVHAAVPPRGLIGIFNRSHYEDVLIARVHELAPRKELNRRYRQINDFERYLTENDVVILKFFLHISRDEQKERLESRLARPDKHWKFNAGDLAERKRWSRYIEAYQRALRECSTPWAPWHVIPANRKWYRNYAVAHVVLAAMERMDLRYPDPEPGLDRIVVDG
jgi:PPK2 family polyphosphate:nucleotide phosphotransferase